MLFKTRGNNRQDVFQLWVIGDGWNLPITSITCVPDYLNPGQREPVTGRISFEDETKKPTQTVHQQTAYWENQASKVVIYWFFYRYESGKTKDLKNLMVTGIFFSAPLAKRTREEALEFYKKYNDEKFK